jgi:hypothetical protein
MQLASQRIRMCIAHPKQAISSRCISFADATMSIRCNACSMTGQIWADAGMRISEAKEHAAHACARRGRRTRVEGRLKPMSLRFEAISTMYFRSQTAFATGLVVLNVNLTVSSDPCPATTRSQSGLAR